MAVPANDVIRKVHTLLVKRVGTLSTQLGKTTDPAAAQSILLEMEELVHRVNLLQKIMFAAESDKLVALLPDVEKADRELAGALQQIEKVGKFVKAAAHLLGKVDKVVDLAKGLVSV
jgi:hypothetical protein